jgi:radical SAM protein with 4Fe4S-binding SPASM domain
MDLIIKPTEVCNFACTFCSSTMIADHKKQVLDLQLVFDFLKRFPKTNTIIVNGGDPLMVPPEYYWKIIDYLDQNNLPAILSFTSNLWDFYRRPDRWTKLFQRTDRVHIATSFNYGDTRRISKNRPFTETDFWKISDLMLERVGYRPGFIAVITDANENTALDTVRLAKKMGVECKVNYAMASGSQSKPFLLGKIYKIYLDIYKAGLGPWEFNTKQMTARLQQVQTVCPLNSKCDSGIRCLQPNGTYHSCGAFGDDHFDDQGKYAIDYNREIYKNEFFLPLKQDYEIQRMKDDCLTCPMFKICNGCHKTIKDYKKLGLVEEHCQIMKQNAHDILELKLLTPDLVGQLASIPQEQGYEHISQP